MSLDLNKDGVVSDVEMQTAELQHDLRKQRAQRRMATRITNRYGCIYSLVSL